MVGYNQRKKQVLEFLLDNGLTTSSELANKLDLSIHNSRFLLRHYFLQGLLNRKNEGFGKVYEITEKGVQRLEYFERIM